ncbi:MAG: trypsin-like peptidase domain-containing protein [Phycisphaeraceae bacterium]|nr:MAG: trypsin-like peptidase domain-containing protein [Phycisphaeraceae bacterium]
MTNRTRTRTALRTWAPLSTAVILAAAGGFGGCHSSPVGESGSSVSGRLAGTDPGLAAARDRVFPALVNIRVVTVNYVGGQESKGGGNGSGTIIGPEGYVVTNQHVVADGRRFFCTLADKREVAAELVGEDPLTDLAVLRLNMDQLRDAGPLPVAVFGDSDTLDVGDTVLAMGSPFSLSRSVTLGIVSNTSRVFTSGFGTEEVEDMELDYGQTTGVFTRWIQHDALINPGNSGGPLVNLRGEIIGINTRGGAGMGFASPSNLARDVAALLIAHGEVPRSWVGVSFRTIAKTGLTEGVLVNSVTRGGPADAAGLRAGDLVLALAGSPVTVRFAEELPPLMKSISDRPIGTDLTLRVRREGRDFDLRLTTERLLPERGDETALRGWGIAAREITEKLARDLRLTSRDGVFVTGVRPGSPADLSEPKIQRGDIIRSIDKRPVAAFRDAVAIYREIMAPTDREKIPEFLLVEVERRGQSQVTVIKPRPELKEDPPSDLPKAWLGVLTQPVFRDLARQLTPEATAGLRVTRVYPGTRAAESDLRVGDIIVGAGDERFNVRGLQDAGLLQRVVRTYRADDRLSLRVVRDGLAVDVPVTLERTRTTPDEAKTDQNRDFELRVRELTFFDRDAERWDEGVAGVLVTGLERVGWAGLAGLFTGDLIQSIAGTPVASIDDFRAVMERLAREQPARVIFVVLRGNTTAYLFAEPEWKPMTKDEERANPTPTTPTTP